ncbi:MAG TPA: formylglycine-generating enzyme family protein, partial [Thermomicrobiales bacterium]|nr:formylglycine-generating enzyme family protein [Thermomicrobiales bacterium]
ALKQRWIPGGELRMGDDRFYPEEAPVRTVQVEGFWIDEHPVTTREFERFVSETGYVTVAERELEPADYPGADPGALVPGSLVFRKTAGPVDLRDVRTWWRYEPGASWRRPEGEDSTLGGKERHPVLHVAWDDVAAYAAWAGKAIPTEAEWEFAARGGLEGKAYAWGDELAPKGKMLANYWQGQFPWQNLALDGYERTAPVGSFPPNGYGLYDMIGNAWEWTADWYLAGHGATHACCGPARDPRGGDRETSIDPNDPAAIPRRVLKGGSFACAENYCQRYRPAARMHHPIDTGTNHVSFRCIVRPESAAAGDDGSEPGVARR